MHSRRNNYHLQKAQNKKEGKKSLANEKGNKLKSTKATKRCTCRKILKKPVTNSESDHSALKIPNGTAFTQLCLG